MAYILRKSGDQLLIVADPRANFHNRQCILWTDLLSKIQRVRKNQKNGENPKNQGKAEELGKPKEW